MRYIIKLPLLGLFALLLACSSEKQMSPSIGNTLMTMAKAKIAARQAEKAGTPKAAPAQLTRAALAGKTKPLIRVSLPKRGFTILALQTARNGSYRTYVTPANQSFTFQGGILTATRGIGLDLMALEYQQDAPVGTTTPRVHKYLTAENHIGEMSLTCSLSAEGVEQVEILEKTYSLARFDEICRGKSRAFKNSYWRNLNTGAIWKSHQWINSAAGHLITEVLIDEAGKS